MCVRSTVNWVLRSIGNLTGLVLTRNAVGSSWEFAAPPCATQTWLIGWVMRERSVDGGIPYEVAALIARAMSRCASITVLGTLAKSGHVSQIDQSEASSCLVKPAGMILSRLKKGYPLVTTRNSALLQALISDGNFSWALKAQRLFLSAPNVLPVLSYEQVDIAFERPESLNCDDMVRNAHLLALMLPAVDGDFVGIISFSEVFWDSLISAFEAECRANQLTWFVVDEATFAATSWFATDS